MTRNEYINAFNTYITANTPPLTPYGTIVSNISKWADQIDETLSECFKAEIEKIAGRLFIPDITKTFKGSRLLSYLVNKDILSDFGKENYSSPARVNCKWFGDVLKGYIKIKGMDPSSLFAKRWAGEFKANSALIFKAAAKTVVAGDCRTVHPISNRLITANTYKGNVLISVIYSPGRKPKDEAEVVKYQDISYDTLNTIEQALALMGTVEKYETQEVKHFRGWKGYEVLVKVREIKCAVPPTDKEINQKKCEEIMNAPKPEASLEELMDQLDDSPSMLESRPEILALKKVYDAALIDNQLATEEYTRAKKLWEESTNRLDRLEQALELLK